VSAANPPADSEAASEPPILPIDTTPVPEQPACEPPVWDSPDDLGRLFVATPGGLSLSQGETEVVNTYRPAGLLIRAYNVQDRAQLQDLLAQIRGNGETMALVDHEGGGVELPAVEPSISSPRTLGQGPVEATRQAAILAGADLRALGFDIDLAPVADVRDPTSGTIGSRAFGTDVAGVTQHALAFATGLREAGVIPAFKHFPGYGRAVGDAHLGLTTVGTPYEELAAVDLEPFTEVVASGWPLIMTSHLHYSSLDAEVIPATISSRIINGLLREELGFRGVVITDSLGMGAITLTVGSEEGAVLALKAGADLMLLTYNVTQLPAFVARVQAAVDSGELPRERVLEALGRVAALQRLARGGDASCLLP
jgi:beta-N-acetylhexosaminidase